MRLHLIPNILKWYFYLQHFLSVSTMSSSCQVIDIYQYSSFNLKVKVGTHFTLVKSLVHQEVVHPGVPCRTWIYSAVTPSEVEHHPPSAFVLYVLKHSLLEWQVTSSTTDILCIHLRSLDTKILYLEKFLLHLFVSSPFSIGFHLQPCIKG